MAEGLVLEYLASPDANDATRSSLAWRITGQAVPNEPPVVLTLFDLMCYYVGSKRFHRSCNAKSQRNVMSALQIMLVGLSPTREVSLIDREVIEAYIRLRRAGGIAYNDYQVLRNGSVRVSGRTTRPVKTRSVEHELTLLQTMIRWACETRCANRNYLLDAPPMRESLLRDFKNTETEHRTPLPREAIQGLLSSALAIGGAASTTDAARWYRLALALLIVDVTGERIGAVRQLRRDDLKFAKRGMSRELEIRYRAETTKANRTRKVLFPPRETELAHQILNEIPVIGHGLLFPTASGQAPATTDTFIADLKALAAQAGVDLPPNSKWHGARARWATDRRHLDPHATMKAGGWSDYETFARYIHLTEDDIRTAIAAPRSDLVLPSFDGTLTGNKEPQPPTSERTRLKLER